MYQRIIIGSGGTGSYFIPHCIRYSKHVTRVSSNGISTKITLLDGDIVEERNLLRQGFYPCDLGKVKSVALKERFEIILPPHVEIEAHQQFINRVDHILRYVDENAEKITLVSCVDNNMARLRIHIAAYVIQDTMGKQVEIIDSGNTEWFGQVLISRFVTRGRTYLSGLYQKIQERGLQGVQEFSLKRQTQGHKVTSVFTPNDNWIERLNRGEHELGCQDHVVSNPQNIATNMLAGATLLQALYLVDRGHLDIGILRFDAKQNTVNPIETPNVEEGYEQRIQEILDYLKTEEGFVNVFGSELLQGNQSTEINTEIINNQNEETESSNITEQENIEELSTEIEQLVGEQEQNQATVKRPTRRRRATPLSVPRIEVPTTVRRVVNQSITVLDDIDNILESISTRNEEDNEIRRL